MKMLTYLVLIILLSGIGAVFLTSAVRQYSLANNIIDIPNSRSSHSTPIPRGGGLAIVLIVLLGSTGLLIIGSFDIRFYGALTGGVPVAVVGWLDDRKPVSASSRLIVHCMSAVWLILLYTPPTILNFGSFYISFGYAGYVIVALVIVWFINSYNFMDGIDGLGGGEGATIFLSGMIIAFALGDYMLALAAALISGACLGFLKWNWPPAKIFMGDVSSGYLGYLIAVSWLTSSQQWAAGIWSWPLLSSVFLIDASLTLFWRIYKRQRLMQAHRFHAYQCAAARYGHLKVTTAVVFFNITCLFPLSLLINVVLEPKFAGPITLIVMLFLALVWFMFRSLSSKETSGPQI